MRYEYIRLLIDMGDLSELNRLSSIGGWRVVSIVRDTGQNFALLERPLVMRWANAAGEVVET